MTILSLVKVIACSGAILSLARGAHGNSQEGEGSSCHAGESTDDEGKSYWNNKRAPVAWVHGEKSLSTEELTAEMANLEGLMKDLNAITQQDFEC